MLQPPTLPDDALADRSGLTRPGEAPLPSPEEAAFIAAHLEDAPAQLALLLGKKQQRKPGLPSLRPAVVLRQVQGFQVIRRKVPSWSTVGGLCYPEHLSLEQCSSERTARYKAGLVAHARRVADLTGGLGVDLAFLAAGAEMGLYVERQAELAAIVQHNYRQLGLSRMVVRTGESDKALPFLKALGLDVIYLDPARRSKGGGKVVALSDCEPDVPRLLPALLEVAPTVLLKLSPMLDVTQVLGALPPTREVHVVSVDNECKELLFMLKKGAPAEDVVLTCVNLKSTGADEILSVPRCTALACEPAFQAAPMTYLYEPNAALLKAGLFNYLTSVFTVSKLHPHSHLYTSDRWLADFPGRGFEVLGWSPYQPKKVKETWPDLTRANLSCRHFPEGVDTVRKRLKLADGGIDYLFATTLLNNTKVVIRSRKVV